MFEAMEKINSGCFKFGMLAVVFSSAMACFLGHDLASQCLPGLHFPESVPWQRPGTLVLLQHSWLCLTEKYNSCRLLRGHMCTICTWFVATQDDSAEVCPWHASHQGRLGKGRGWLLCIFSAWTVNLTLLENVRPLMSVGVYAGTLVL